MTQDKSHSHLSRRERQIMDIVYAAGRASAAEVQRGLADPPSYSAVRALLKILEEKGHLKHEQVGPRYVFMPTISQDKARRRALAHLVRTFFEDSTERAVAALLDSSASDLSDEQLDRLQEMIDQARGEGR